MKYRFDFTHNPVSWPSKTSARGSTGEIRCGFTLIEVVTALMILSIIFSGVFSIINRSLSSAMDTSLQIQAFEVSRENIERLLSKNSAGTMVEYGQSDLYPTISYKTIVEGFYEPVTNRMWLGAKCESFYTDSEDQQQTVTLTHWLTSLNEQEIRHLLHEDENQRLDLIESLEEAADFVGVSEDEIIKWLENGMEVGPNGEFIPEELLFYKQCDGNPTDAQRAKHEKIKDLVDPNKDAKAGPKPDPAEPDPTEPDKPEKKGPCGKPMDELLAMDRDEMWKFLWNCEDL